MDPTEQERLKGCLARLKRLLLQPTDPAVATVISDDIANMKTRLRAPQSSIDLQTKHSS
jgi:hypothetical protein